MFLPAFAPSSAVFAIAFSSPVFQQQPPAPPASAPAAPAATKYEFPTKLTPGEPRLIEIRTTTNSTFHLDLAGKATDTRERAESTNWIVDTLLDPATQPKDHVWSGRRRVVKATATKDGVVDDPETNGFEAAVWVDQTNQISVETTTERILVQSSLEELLHSAQAFGLGDGVSLPTGAAVGDAFEMPFATLAPWCLTTDGKTPQAIAHLHFDSVDAKKNVARFKGPVHVEEVVEKSAEAIDAPFGIKGTGIYDGAVSIEYDVAAHRIARIVCAAKATFSGETVGKVTAKVSGTNAIETTITCSVGAPAASALNQKTQYRDVPHAIENAGISIALPSHFTKSTVQKPPITACLSFLHGKDAVAIVSILPLALQVKSVKEAGEETRKELESVGFKVKDVTASGGLGATSAVEYVNDKQHGLNVVFMLEPGRFVDVQCACPEAVWAECSKEWPKYLQSLKKLPAAK